MRCRQCTTLQCRKNKLWQTFFGLATAEVNDANAQEKIRRTFKKAVSDWKKEKIAQLVRLEGSPLYSEAIAEIRGELESLRETSAASELGINDETFFNVTIQGMVKTDMEQSHKINIGVNTRPNARK